MDEQSDLFGMSTERKCGTCGSTMRETQYWFMCLVCDNRISKPQPEPQPAVHRRPPGPATRGEELRDETVQYLKELRVKALTELRAYLRACAKSRADRTVTTKEAHDHFDKMCEGNFEMSTWDRRFFGALFTKEWEYTGEVEPGLDRAHARPIKRWRLK